MEKTNELTIIKGDLIQLALEKQFDIIAHGCNCQSVMGSGIAVPMKNTFDCDKFPLELLGPNNYKLGLIDFKHFIVKAGTAIQIESPVYKDLTVVNAYTQLFPGIPDSTTGVPVNYSALKNALILIRDLLVIGDKKKVGLPWIGCGLAGGSKETVLQIICEVFEDSLVEIFIVEYDR